MNEMRKLMETLTRLNEEMRIVPFALYSSEDGMGRRPEIELLVGKIVGVPDTGNYQKNKQAALQKGIESGIIASKNELGFWGASEITEQEIGAMRSILQDIERLQ